MIIVMYLKYNCANLKHTMCWFDAFVYCNVIAIVPMGFLGNSDAKQSAHSWRELGSTMGQEDPLENGMTTHSNNLLRECHKERSLMVYSP